jgi:serine/threonine-protein kinase
MPEVGDTVAHYTLEALLGQGGMGSVFLAQDRKLQRRVALKVLASDHDASARILKEARAAAALDHPGVVVLHEVGEDSGVCYIAMELVQGRTLRAAMADASIPRETRLRWLREIASILGAAHERGVVHRDIKPENVMVRDDGSLKLLDFGIARRRPAGTDPTATTQPLTTATLTERGLLLGTPFYMAPEQLRGAPVDGRSDQFAWAVLAHEVLTGALPWRGGDDLLATIAAVLTDPADEAPLRAAGVPAPFRAALLRALQKNPDERFPTMHALLAALDAPPASPSPPSLSSSRPTSMPASSLSSSRPPSTPASSPPPSPLASTVSHAAPKGSSTTHAARYSTAELRAVLSLAIDRQAESDQGRGRYSFDELLEAAREVGVQDAVLREASRELRQSGASPGGASPGGAALAEDDSFQVWKRRQRRGFLRHLGAFAMVNLAFLILGVMVGAIFPMLIPGLFWAIGVGIHGINVLTSDEDEWREKQQKRARRGGHRRSAAVEEGAALLLQTSADRRLRVAPPAKVRVEAQTPPVRQEHEDDALAQEAEAALEDRRRGQRRG